MQGSNLRRLSRRFYRGHPHLRIDSPLPAHLLPCRLMRAPPEPLLNHEHPPPAGHGRAQPDKAALRSGTGIRQTPCPVLIRWQADPDRRERKRPRTGSGAAATRPAEGVNLAAASTYVSAVGRRRESRTEAHGGTPPGAAPPGMIAASRPTAATRPAPSPARHWPLRLHVGALWFRARSTGTPRRSTSSTSPCCPGRYRTCRARFIERRTQGRRLGSSLPMTTIAARPGHNVVMALSGEFKIGIIFSVLLAVAAAGSAPWWWKYVDHGTTAGTAVVGMSGGCAPFQVFAQNRWAPAGTAIRDAPNVLSAQNGSFPRNMSISVDGWVNGRPASTRPIRRPGTAESGSTWPTARDGCRFPESARRRLPSIPPGLRTEARQHPHHRDARAQSSNGGSAACARVASARDTRGYRGL